MSNLLKKIFSPPYFEDELQARNAFYINAMLWLGLVIFSALSLKEFLAQREWNLLRTDYVFLGFFSIALFTLFLHILLRLRKIKLVTILMLLGNWLFVMYSATRAEGIHDSGLYAVAIFVIIAGLFLGQRWSIAIAGISIAAYYLIAFMETTRVITPAFDTPYNVATYASAILIFTTLGILLAFNQLEAAIRSRQEQAQLLEKSQKELQSVNANLESLVAERTQALEIQNARIQQANQRLTVISDIATTITQVKDLQALLNEVVHLISDKMGFYHAGIFLVDERREYAVLQAASSEGGQKMLARKHRLPIEPSSLVGFAVSQKQSRIALDTGADAIHFDNPDLPETRSEIALPLMVKEQVIGVLDIQSQEKNAFTQQDIEIFQILANQVAMSIDNANLFVRTQQALSDAQKIYQQFIQKNWQILFQTLENRGYHYDGLKLQPISAEDSQEGSQSKGMHISQPIILNDIVIGYIEINRQNQRPLTDDETRLVETVAQRTALAMENARLLAAVQKQASRQQLIGEIGGKIIRSLDVENILHTTVSELGNVLPDADISVQITPPAETDEQEKGA